MSVSDSGPSNAGEHPVGSLGEEAAKLFAALGGWGGVRAGAEEHSHAAESECRFCPLCQLAGGLRKAHPEAVEHLSAAAGSLVHALNALMAPPMPWDRNGEDTGVERIDLSDESDWEGEQ